MQRKYRLKPDTNDRKHLLQHAHQVRGIGGAPLRAITLPRKADLRKYVPYVSDQGELGSCASQATCNLMKMLNVAKKGKLLYDPAVLFEYFNARVLIEKEPANEDTGTTIYDVMQAANREGVCSSATWPYNVQKFSQIPSRVAYAEGLQHRVGSFFKIPGDLNNMKSYLARGIPFIGGFQIYESFETVSSNGKVPIPNPAKEELLGGHALTFVGYDDDLHSMIILNSWGPRWGDKGYCYMDYNQVTNPNFAYDFYGINSITY